MAVAQLSVLSQEDNFLFLNQIKAQKQLISQIFHQPKILPRSPFTTDNDNNRGVINLFAIKQATPEQAHDLLHVHKIEE